MDSVDGHFSFFSEDKFSAGSKLGKRSGLTMAIKMAEKSTPETIWHGQGCHTTRRRGTRRVWAT